MSIITALIVLAVIFTFGNRLKETLSKALDLVDSTLEVGETHLKSMNKDAKQSSKLRSLEKQADSLKRVKRLNKSLGSDAIDISSLKDQVSSDAKSAFARKPKK